MAELRTSVEKRKKESWTAAPSVDQLRVIINKDGKLLVEAYDPTRAGKVQLDPTHWGFGQLATYAKAPATYLRSLPSKLAAINLQYGLENNAVRDTALVLAQSNGNNQLRAITSQSYGRIWDIQVVQAVEKANRDGRWKIPAASYATQNPKRATTLYASDRDVFIFLVDDQHPVEIGNEKLFRGFYTWNSEVGAATFGLTTFLYRTICDNRIIWGATDVKELRIRHTGGAPERFGYEGAKLLKRYSEENTVQTVNTIKAAQKFELPVSDKEKDGWQGWLRDRGFSDALAKNAISKAKEEEGEVRSLWDIVNGVTAFARTIPHTDARIEVEQKAGKLLSLVAK